MTAVLNLCLNLNIWCAAFLADRKGSKGTASQTLVQIARSGRAGTMPVQLVISWGMLTRLRKVLEVDWKVARGTVDLVIAVLCISRHQHQLVRQWQHEDHSPLFSREYKSWPNRMLLLP
jgi:hypothetical protein